MYRVFMAFVFCFLSCTAGVPRGVTLFSDEPEHPRESIVGFKTADSCEQALEIWKTPEDVSAWIAGSKKDGRYYFFADSKRPEYLPVHTTTSRHLSKNMSITGEGKLLPSGNWIHTGKDRGPHHLRRRNILSKGTFKFVF